MATFSQRVVSITQDTILPKVIDNILSDNFMTYRYLGTGEKWSGETLKRPIKIAKNTNGSSFSGMDTFSTATVESRITMSYDVRGYSIPVAIPGLEKAVNNVSETQVLSLIRTELESTQMDGLDDIGSIFYLDGTGNNNKDFFGLDNLDDDGTSATNVGNTSRTTYATLKGTRTSAAAVLSVAKLATMFDAIAAGSAMSQRPTMIVSSEVEFSLYDSLLMPAVRNNYESNGLPMVTRKSKRPVPASDLHGTAGFTSLVYRGVPWVADEKATLGTVWFLNENYLQWYGLTDPELEKISVGAGTNVDGPYSDQPTENSGFQWTGFMKPFNQYAEVAHIMLLGNMTTFQPRRHGRLTSVTGV